MTKTYGNNKRINPMPGGLKVGNNSECKQLQTHLDGENHNVEIVESFHDLFSHRSFLQGDVFEGKGQTGSHDQEEDGPLEGAVFNNTSHSSSESGAADTERSTADHATLTTVVTAVTIMSFVFVNR